MRKLALAGLGGLAALAAGGCGGSNWTTRGQTDTVGSTATEKVIVQTSKGAFSPEAIYRKVSPGVVTILSISQAQAGNILGLGGGQSAGEGSGFVVGTNGEIVTNAHVVTTGGVAAGGGPVRVAKQIYAEFAYHNRVPAQLAGVDPDAGRALIKLDP